MRDYAAESGRLLPKHQGSEGLDVFETAPKSEPAGNRHSNDFLRVR